MKNDWQMSVCYHWHSLTYKSGDLDLFVTGRMLEIRDISSLNAHNRLGLALILHQFACLHVENVAPQRHDPRA